MLEIKYKHYIRLNSQNEIIHAFSDAFNIPEEADILLEETEERHCQLQIMSEKYIGKYKYKYVDGQIIEKTEEELYTAEERKADKIKAIKAEAERKILEKYPYYKQINLIAEMDSKKDTKEKKQEMVDFINSVRNWSNEEINKIEE
ncbi:MAG TPA: hypothetical protein PLQ61_06905 [Bacteroidales bacterium]|nr:hypothetical protein [Petrotogaceae bacterium]HQJ20906.1 hypothetical protein [Bacteroidales bacterium]